ncbi:MAG: ABC transporter ATP-binding protein [Chloroflexi bacterium]|nr:ABC transporter ATP-binding protein [Chloroflexota bacterium]
MEDQDNIIVTKDLSKSFDDQFAVQGLNLEVPRNVIFGFIGPSGSGKTTTIRMLTGVYKPTNGQVKVLGSDPKRFSQKTRARIGYMPQLFVLYPHLTIWENMNFAASLYGMGLRRSDRLRQALDFVELTEHRDKLTNEISGGMQRRLSLAATLVHDPELIFLDEPTAGVDPVLRSKFWDRFRELRSSGRTLFVTTQYVGEAVYCDLIAVLQEGRLLTVDTPKGLRQRAFGGDLLNLKTVEPLDYNHEQLIGELPFVRKVTRQGPTRLRLVVGEGKTDIPALLAWATGQGLHVENLDEFVPPFDEVFVELVKPEAENV